MLLQKVDNVLVDFDFISMRNKTQVLSLELRIKRFVIRVSLVSILSLNFILDLLLRLSYNVDQSLFIFVILDIPNVRHHLLLDIFLVVSHTVVRAIA